MDYAARSETGPVRQENQDSCVADPELGLFMVCDGMGGHLGGARASQLACAVVSAELGRLGPLAERAAPGKRIDGEELCHRVTRAVLLAHRAICEEADTDLTKAGMGTTCTLLLLCGDGRGVLGHVGDSRLYQLAGGKVERLSEDHSLVNELVKRGTLTEAEAAVHPQANVILRALGASPGPEVDTRVLPVDGGRTFLLCSDGLTRYFRHDQELAPVLGAGDCRSAVDRLVQTALDAGGRDNVTAVVLRP